MSATRLFVAAVFALAPTLSAAQGCDDHSVRISCEAGKVWDEKTQGCITVSS